MALSENPSDPRLLPQTGAPDQDVRPVVARPRSGPPLWLLGLFALAAAILLFLLLERARKDGSGSGMARSDDPAPPPPPPLIIPPPAQPIVEQSWIQSPPSSPVIPTAAAQVREAPPAPPQPQIVYVQRPAPMAATPLAPNNGGATLVVDTTAARNNEGAGAAAGIAGRVTGGTLVNRSMTVPQGTLIAAVLETAFNSDRPGFARAVVAHDVRGFDGSRILIPRGSRLIGEYRGEVMPGQKRALINWTRLLRPDGVTMPLASPSTDTLGRGGIKARVNTHFLERFQEVILQSSIDIGLTLAAAGIGGNGVFVALPNGQANNGANSNASRIPPTLTIPAARRISIFVAQDLDFSAVGAAP